MPAMPLTSCVHAMQELRPDSVEAEESEQVAAMDMFQGQLTEYLGWYHSHPRIKPLPSRRDVTMQSEFQAQMPYSFGLICSS